jgi:hypothetical protein
MKSIIVINFHMFTSFHITAIFLHTLSEGLPCAKSRCQGLAEIRKEKGMPLASTSYKVMS